MINSVSSSITDNKKIEETEEKIIQFLRDHPEVEIIIPVIIGLIITSRFQLRGSNALIVNLAVASIARQIFMNLNKVSPTDATAASTAANLMAESETNSPYKIVHKIPGRIRLKVPQLSKDVEFASNVQTLLNEDDHVINVRINGAAASVVIYYDAQGLSDLELGLRLLSIMNKAQGSEL